MKFRLFIILLSFIFITACGGDKNNNNTEQADKAQQTEQAPKAETAMVVKAEKAPSKAEYQPEPGNELKAVYPGEGYDFIVEVSKNKTFYGDVPIEYLYLKREGGDKKLIAQSRDEGEDWTSSIAEILNPVMSPDGRRVHFETDNTFTRTNGYGAANHRNFFADLSTGEVNYFDEGAIFGMIKEENSPLNGALILQTHTKNDDWETVPFFQLYSSQGKKIVNLGTDSTNIMQLIDKKMEEEHPGKRIEQVLNEGLSEQVRDEWIHYEDYSFVVIEDYPEDGKFVFSKVMEFDNPYYEEQRPNKYNIAVIGSIKDVKLKTRRHMNDEPEIYDIAGELENTLLKVSSWFPNDFSVDQIVFKDNLDQEYSIPVEDMSDNQEIIKYKYPF